MSKKKELTLREALEKMRQSGLEGSRVISEGAEEWKTLGSIEDRISYIFGIIKRENRKATDMLFFVMYDIESNKVRRHISKYLERMGCHRVQRSIYLADLPMDKYDKIKSDLTEVQSYYENDDSILVVPVSTDMLRSMRVIGQKIDVDVILRTKNTLFF